MRLQRKIYWRREDGFAGITLATVATVAGITSAAVGIGATAYGLSKGTPNAGPSSASPLYGSGLPNQNAGNYGNNAPAEAINEWEHQDISLPGNTYGSIPEGTSVYGSLAQGKATVNPALNSMPTPLAPASESSTPLIVQAPATGGVSSSELLILAGGVVAIGAAIFLHRHKKS